jgi:hypothetical protein
VGGQTPFRIIVLTCREPRTDFRLPLVEALRRKGHEVHYVRLGRRPMIAGRSDADGVGSTSLTACIRYLRRVTMGKNLSNIYFVTTNLLFPTLILALRVICAPGIWCFDMHDDLLYGTRGLVRLRARVRQAMLLRTCDLVVHAAPTLQELFPRSHHLGNASSVTRSKRIGNDFGRMLILASIDERMDFALLDATAARCQEVQFEIYGQVAPAVEPAMREVLLERRNVHHHGPYVTDQLVPILERFTVMLAPYRIHTRLTRYLDPLRYYHALNSGVEVITTDIPQARAYADRLHIVQSADEVAQVLERLRTGGGSKAARAPLITWDQRAEELTDILADEVRQHG